MRSFRAVSDNLFQNEVIRSPHIVFYFLLQNLSTNTVYYSILERVVLKKCVISGCVCVFQIYFQMIPSVKNCCLYLGLSDYPIIVTEQLKEMFKDKNLFFAYVGQLLSSANPGANHLFLATLIGAKWQEVMKAA